jgi:transcriptional regulator with XRE-family HTH domain
MRPTFKDIRDKALLDPDVRREYDELAPTYELRKRLISMRKQAGLTQENLAEMLHTKKSNISRLENVYSKSSPKLSTIEAYAEAVGYKMEIRFISRST